MDKTYGYVRVSTKGQNIDRQMIKLKELNVKEEDIYIDKASGATMNRPAYNQLRSIIEEGDIMYIDSLDRLGRNWAATVAEWQYIVHDVDADIISLTDSESFLNSRNFKEMGDVGPLLETYVLSTLAFVAESERRKKLDYQAEGIKAARERGQHLGRPTISALQQEKIRKRFSERLYDVLQISDLVHLPVEQVAALLKLQSDEDLLLHCHEKEISWEIAMLAKLLGEKRKYSLHTIAEDAGVSPATVFNYTKDLK